MAFQPSYNSRLYVGPIMYAQYVKDFGGSSDVDQLDVTTLANADGTPKKSKEFINGKESTTVTINAYLDGTGTAGSQFALANTWKSTAQVVTLLPYGGTRGSLALNMKANQSDVTVMSDQGGVVEVAHSLVADGETYAGVVIDPLTAITADTNGTSVDNGAASTNGGWAHLHVTAFTGLTSDSVIVEHSTNDSVWATLGTFTLVAGTTSERLEIAPGTTVNRYLRIRDDVTGTGSCTRIVSFARR